MEQLLKKIDGVLDSVPSVAFNATKEEGKLSINLAIGEASLNVKGSPEELANTFRILGATLATKPAATAPAPAPTPAPAATKAAPKEEMKKSPAEEAPAPEDLPPVDEFGPQWQKAIELNKAGKYKESLEVLNKCLSMNLTAKERENVNSAIEKLKAKMQA